MNGTADHIELATQMGGVDVFGAKIETHTGVILCSGDAVEVRPAVGKTVVKFENGLLELNAGTVKVSNGDSIEIKFTTIVNDDR